MTNAQLQTLKTFIVNDATLNAFPNTTDGNIDLAAALDVPASPTFYVFRTNIPTQEIFDQVTWANLTPSDAPDGTQAWLNRSMACQGKQFNLQTLLMGQDAINASRSNVRAGLQDALTGVPSGANGATQAAGWVGVRDTVLARPATRGEKLFATTTGQLDGSTAAKAATLVIEGRISAQDVNAARNL